MGHYSFTHKAFGLRSHGPGRTSAHIFYITRPSECDRAVGWRMPSNRFQAMSWANKFEESLPKGSYNVTHSFIIGLPRSFDIDEMEQTMIDFGKRIHNKAPFYFTISGKDTHNPHCHFDFFDADADIYYQEGRVERVAHLSMNRQRRAKAGLEPNPTRMLRVAWQDAANENLERCGYDDRIDHRTLKEQGIDREPEEHRGPANDNEDKLAFIDNETLDEAPTVAAQANQFRATYHAYEDLKFHRDEVARLKEAIPVYDRAAAVATAEAQAEKERATAAERAREEKAAKAAEYTKDDGSLKGWRLKVLGLEWKSGTRKAAEHAHEELENQDMQTRRLKREAEDKSQYSKLSQEQSEMARDSLGGYQRKLQAYGTEQEQAEAEALLKASAKQIAAEIDLDDLDKARERGEVTDDVWQAVHEGVDNLKHDLDYAHDPDAVADHRREMERDDEPDLGR